MICPECESEKNHILSSCWRGDHFNLAMKCDICDAVWIARSERGS